LRSGLGISRDAGRIVVGGPRDQSGSEQPPEDIRTFIRCFVEFSFGGIHALRREPNPASLPDCQKITFGKLGGLELDDLLDVIRL
jgi:hypothetical protein